jgi:hypothetical protein
MSWMYVKGLYCGGLDLVGGDHHADARQVGDGLLLHLQAFEW